MIWNKDPSEAVTKATLIVFMKYSNILVTDASGMIYAKAEGINIAEASMTGQVLIKSGDNSAVAPPTTISNALQLLRFIQF